MSTKSNQLRMDNRAMELQLHKLRNQIERDRAKFEDIKKTKDGSIWASGAPARGSLRSFAAEVRSKKQQDCDTAGTKSNKKKKKILRGDEAGTWTKNEVLAWLDSIGLTQQKNVFRDNEITGEVLLELGVDDLDYMGITALGVRKSLLKEVARLKRCAKVDIPGTPISARRPTEQKEMEPTQNLQQQQQQPQPPNFDGELDEEAEHAAFRKAVEEWRNAGRKNTNQDSDIGISSSSSGSGTSNGQKTIQVSITSSEENSLLNGSIDEEAEHRAFQKAVEEWRQHKSCDVVEPVSFDSYKQEKKEAVITKMLQEYEENLKKSHTKKTHIMRESKDEEKQRGEQEEEEEEEVGYYDRRYDYVESKEVDVSGWDFENAY